MECHVTAHAAFTSSSLTFTISIYSYTHTNTPSHTGLCDSGANLFMTNNPNLLVDVRQCEPSSISLATSDGGHSHTNVCSRRGLLPLPLINGTS